MSFNPIEYPEVKRKPIRFYKSTKKTMPKTVEQTEPRFLPRYLRESEMRFEQEAKEKDIDKLLQQAVGQLPKGSTVTGITRTREGAYQISYVEPEPSWKETTAAGRVLTGKAKSPLGTFLESIGAKQQAKDVEQWYAGQEWLFHPFGTKQASREISAGIISYPESTLRAIGGLVGRPTTSPPTYMGGVIGKFLGRTEEWEEVQKLPLTYHVGGFIGGAAESVVLGFAVEKAWGGLKTVAPRVVKEPFIAAKETVRFSRVAKFLHEIELGVKSKVPYWKLYEPFKKEIARGEFAIPSFERFGISELEAEAVAWGSLQTSRMGGVMLAREMGEATTHQGFSILMKDIAKGWILKEATFTPLISQTQVTRMGIQPYIPKLVATTGKKAGYSLLGAFATAIPKLAQPERLTPKTKLTWQPTLPQERERLKPQQLLEFEPKRKERETPLLLPSIIPGVTPTTTPLVTPWQIPKQETRQAPLQVPKQAQAMTPSLKQAQALLYGKPTRQTAKFGYPMWPKMTLGGGPRRGEPQGLFGRWFRKQHRIKTPQQVAALFGLSTTRRKRGKRGRLPRL